MNRVAFEINISLGSFRVSLTFERDEARNDFLNSCRIRGHAFIVDRLES